MFRLIGVVVLMSVAGASGMAQSRRPAPPTRDPHTAGYVKAKELPDGEVPPANADGNFIIGPTHNTAPEMAEQEGVPKGTVCEFVMESTESKIYPGIARERARSARRIRTIRRS